MDIKIVVPDYKRWSKDERDEYFERRANRLKNLTDDERLIMKTNSDLFNGIFKEDDLIVIENPFKQ